MRILKTLKRMLLTFVAASLIVVCMPFSSSAISDNVEEIFKFLVTNMNLSPAAACGVLANIEYESDFNPTLVGDGGTSYGICQWHNSRFTNLRNFCASNGLSYKTIQGQLKFLEYELKTNKSDTGYILDKLSAVQNNADGAYKAGYNWCYYFERPANKEYKSDYRGNVAKNKYWPLFKNAMSQSQVTKYSSGDVNRDFNISSSDALLVLQYVTGSKNFDNEQLLLADANCDGKINSGDALYILNICVGS